MSQPSVVVWFGLEWRLVYCCLMCARDVLIGGRTRHLRLGSVGEPILGLFVVV